MIKMVAGIYGYKKDGKLEAKNAKSEPFTLDPKEEERLVKAGVAKYVEVEPRKVITQADNENAVKNKGLTEMSFEELKALATEKGITVSGKSKQAYIDALMEDMSEDNASTGDNDLEPPTFGDSMVVTE